MKSEPDPSASRRSPARSRASWRSSGLLGVGDLLQPRAREHADLLLRVLDLGRRAGDERFERGGAAGVQESAAVAVRVDVGDRLRRKLVRVRLDPFRRAEEPLLLAVPGAEDDRALRPPSLLKERADGAGLLEHRDEAADRVLGAVDPRVVVVAADHPLVGPHGAGNVRDDVAHGHHVPVERELDVHGRRARADAVRDRQRSAPRLRRNRTLECGEKRPRVRVRDREHRDLRDRLRVLPVEALRIGGRADAGRQRVAGVQRHVCHAAALHALLRTERALRVDLALEVAVVPGVRINDAGERAPLRRDLRLDAAPAASVARDHDPAAHVDAELIEGLVVVGVSVVDVDEGRGRLAVDREGVVGRQLLRGLGGRRVAGNRRLGERGAELRRRDQLEHSLLRSREEHVERLDARVESPRAEALEDPLRVLRVLGRAEMVRRLRQATHRLARHGGVGKGAERALDAQLFGGAFREEAPRRGRRRRWRRGDEHGERERGNETFHGFLSRRRRKHKSVAAPSGGG